MKKEILKTLPYALITESEDPTSLPARTTLEYLQMTYDALPAKLKNHKQILIQFNNREQVIQFYYLRELEPGERPDPEPTPEPAQIGVHPVDDNPPEPAAPRPRPYMKNFDPEFTARKTFDAG